MASISNTSTSASSASVEPSLSTNLTTDSELPYYITDPSQLSVFLEREGNDEDLEWEVESEQLVYVQLENPEPDSDQSFSLRLHAHSEIQAPKPKKKKSRKKSRSKNKSEIVASDSHTAASSSSASIPITRAKNIPLNSAPDLTQREPEPEDETSVRVLRLVGLDSERPLAQLVRVGFEPTIPSNLGPNSEGLSDAAEESNAMQVQMQPSIRESGPLFAGTYEDISGTFLFFERNPLESEMGTSTCVGDSRFKLLGKSEKLLRMRPVQPPKGTQQDS